MSSTFLYGANVCANNIRQHYLRYGGKGTPLLLVPGITSPAITWGFVAERLGEHFDTYVLDVRGRGLSSTGPDLSYDIDSCVDDIIEFAKELGLKDFILLGHSMGARFGIRAARKGLAGLSRLVLADPPVSGPGRREYPSKLPWYVDSIRDATRGCDLETMRQYCPTWTDEQLHLRAEWLHTCYSPAIVKAFNDFHEDDIFPDLPAVKVPTQLMVAGKGGVIQEEDIEEFQDAVANLTVSHVPNAGHMIPWDDLEGFLNSLYAFLDV
ncbi:alpha/beta fold hydrolase [Marinobacterium lutimaris]|uniref:N-formylmaleamate deformylase n=1 Tax=Marinobacterium lutimaris TaxID=568106 RepID=A0A1H6DPJ4_9GAMM|nr:alpha/beta hydrolase [Marinobacterium lutimaris]SEG87229.1 N-formylmaleamate deformylase [Marinobacterium lutimaris]